MPTVTANKMNMQELLKQDDYIEAKCPIFCKTNSVKVTLLSGNLLHNSELITN